MAPSAPARNTADKAEARERRAQVWALLGLALLVLIGSILRFGVHRVFTSGWWRLW